MRYTVSAHAPDDRSVQRIIAAVQALGISSDDISEIFSQMRNEVLISVNVDDHEQVEEIRRALIRCGGRALACTEQSSIHDEI